MEQKPYHGRLFLGFRALRLFPWPLWLLLLVLAAPGCTRARANTLPSGPPLDIPPPPPRIVMPVDLPVEAEAPPPEPDPPPEEPRRQPAPTRPRVAGPVEPPKTAEEPPPAGPAPAPPAPTTTLQTTPAAEQGEVERTIRATMARASAGLNRIDYRALNANARTQYDTAKRFIQQAEDAIRMQNLPFAKNLADKAATLAVQLGGQ
jgi:hypothetical protein